LTGIQTEAERFFLQRDVLICDDGYLWKRFSAGLTDYNCFYIQQKLLAGPAFADNNEDEQPFGATNVII
jgi:hypothetical protein